MKTIQTANTTGFKSHSADVYWELGSLSRSVYGFDYRKLEKFAESHISNVN